MIYPLDSVQLQHNCYLYNGHLKKKGPYDPILVQNRPNCNLHHLKKKFRRGMSQDLLSKCVALHVQHILLENAN